MHGQNDAPRGTLHRAHRPEALVHTQGNVAYSIHSIVNKTWTPLWHITFLYPLLFLDLAIQTGTKSS